MKEIIFGKVCIIGVGMLGGSMGMALKKRNLCDEVAGVGRNKARLKLASYTGAIDSGTTDLAKGVKGADLVIIATPVGMVADYARAILPYLKDKCLITDLGSTKKEIVSEIERFLPDNIYFVGSHPLAGSEKSGVKFANPVLFEGCTCVLTPTGKTVGTAVKKLKCLWEKLGANVVILSPERHDEVVALISHLPHLAACSLVSVLNNDGVKFVSTGFRDTTRVAASDPLMWRDICLTNREQILRQLDRYIITLNRVKGMLKRKNGRCLETWLEKVKVKRKAL
ncbi:MAG: prephenate dehydrogenase/arogenate dehydrogenase family protein [Candidatus Omnitrophica bacterium]|nr:prephenate dehydrogenase/arogenate dehydrogenase family protein [Candidatus Omnitrophota bacterium]